MLITIGSRSLTGHGTLLVQRHLAHTVDGIVSIIHMLGHAVLGTLHHHAGAEHATEVSTLDAVHQTTGIDGQHTILLPILGIGFPFAFIFIIIKNRSIIVSNRFIFKITINR